MQNLIDFNFSRNHCGDIFFATLANDFPNIIKNVEKLNIEANKITA